MIGHGPVPTVAQVGECRSQIAEPFAKVRFPDGHVSQQVFRAPGQIRDVVVTKLPGVSSPFPHLVGHPRAIETLVEARQQLAAARYAFREELLLQARPLRGRHVPGNFHGFLGHIMLLQARQKRQAPDAAGPTTEAVRSGRAPGVPPACRSASYRVIPFDTGLVSCRIYDARAETQTYMSPGATAPRRL